MYAYITAEGTAAGITLEALHCAIDRYERCATPKEITLSEGVYFLAKKGDNTGGCAPAARIDA
jgi:hypothetical protein